MAQVVVEMTSDERKALAGIQKLIAADEQLAKSLQDAAMVGRGAGDAIGKSLAAAIEKANVDKLLADMRKLGPEGQKAAKAIEQQMAQAGKGGRKSMEQIMEELRKIDPATADIAQKARENLDAIADTKLTGFADTAVAKLGAVVAGWKGVGDAVQAVNGYLDQQIERMERSRSLQVNVIAPAQQEAGKNLADLRQIRRRSCSNTHPGHG